MTYADGTLVKGPSDPLVYLVANGQKRGFVSGSVFTGLGFSFANIQSAPVNTFSDLPTGANLESATERHTAGVLVNSGGTVWKMTATGRMGIPSMEVFNSYGYSFAKVVAANSADTSAANEGVVTARAACSGGDVTPPVTGNVTVSLASDNPAVSTLVTGQATADLAHFMFSGSGTVNSVVFARIGVSADSTLSNVYLFDGSTRITDAASVSDGKITFTNSSGLFAVSGSKNLAVKSDIATGTSGQTVGVRLDSAALASGSVGGLPVSGNIHTIASATLAGVAVGTPLPSSAATTDPGNDVRVWESTFTITTRDVVLSRLALRQINSVLPADVKNFRLLVDGVQQGSAVSQVDANGYVTFSGFTKTLATGSRVVKVIADVIGGSSRIIQMSLRNKADLDAKDSQYGVNVSATGTFPASTATLTINSGSMTVVKATDSPSGNVADGASNVKLAKYTFTAYGEGIKVETLLVDFTHVTSGDVAETSTLRNGKVVVNGSQVGSTTTLDPASTGTSFTTNFIVNPGSPASVEVYADMFDNDGTDAVSDGDKITVTLSLGSSNATRQISLGTINVPSANVAANQVTVAAGSITLASATNYTSHTVVVPKTNYKVGAWNLTGGTTEDVNMHTFSLDIDETSGTTFNEDDLTDCYLKYGSSQSTVKSSMTAADNDWSVSFTLATNVVMPIELYCNIGSTVTATHALKTDLTATGTGAMSSASVSQADKDGQTLTGATSGSLTEAIGAGNPITSITEDNVTKKVAAFKWTAADESFTLSEINVNVAAATTVSNVILKDSTGATLATRPGATDVTFGGISVPIAVGATVELSVELQLGAVGTGAGTSREDVAVTLDSYKKRDSQGVETEDTDNVAGNSHFVFKAIPVATQGSVSSVLALSEMDLYRLTVKAQGGPVAVKQLAFKVTFTDITDDTLTIGSLKFYKDGNDYTDSVRIVDQGGVNAKSGGTAIGESDTDIYVTFGSDAQSEDQVADGSTVEYKLRGTPAGFDAADKDSFRIEMLADSATANRYLNDADATTAEIVATIANSAGTTKASLPQYFLWSDISAVPHDADVVDDADGTADTSTSTADWSNGYLVKNFPLSSSSFSFPQ